MLRRGVLAVGLLLAGISVGSDKPPAKSPKPQTAASPKSTATSPALDAQEYVRRASAEEVKDTEHPEGFFRYTLRKETPSGSYVRDMIETPEGIVARALSNNDQPLTPEERRHDDEKLDQLARDPDERHHRFDQQKEEQRKVVALIRALPDAAIYEPDGSEIIRGRKTLRFRFHSNPRFDATTRETLVFRAAVGELWIDEAANRIVKLEATLVDDISFGWGLLGHIRKGGKVSIEQTAVSQKAWRLSTLIIQAQGSALIFKTISIQQRQFGTDYRPVPPGMSVESAIAELRRTATSASAKP